MYSKKLTLIIQTVFLFWRFNKFSKNMKFHLHQLLKVFLNSLIMKNKKIKVSKEYRSKFSKEFIIVSQDCIKS